MEKYIEGNKEAWEADLLRHGSRRNQGRVMIMNLRNEGIYDPDMDPKGNRE